MAAVVVGDLRVGDRLLLAQPLLDGVQGQAGPDVLREGAPRQAQPAQHRLKRARVGSPLLLDLADPRRDRRVRDDDAFRRRLLPDLDAEDEQRDRRVSDRAELRSVGRRERAPAERVRAPEAGELVGVGDERHRLARDDRDGVRGNGVVGAGGARGDKRREQDD